VPHAATWAEATPVTPHAVANPAPDARRTRRDFEEIGAGTVLGAGRVSRAHAAPHQEPAMSEQNTSDSIPQIHADDLAKATGGRLHGEYGVERTWNDGNTVLTQTGTYKVGAGDNLSSIARATNQSVADLIRQNPQYAGNPNLIHPGDRVVTGSSKVARSGPKAV
jgi:LysM repeat protein